MSVNDGEPLFRIRKIVQRGQAHQTFYSHRPTDVHVCEGGVLAQERRAGLMPPPSLPLALTIQGPKRSQMARERPPVKALRRFSLVNRVFRPELTGDQRTGRGVALGFELDEGFGIK